LRASTSIGSTRPSASARPELLIAADATSACISITARCGGFSPRATASRERAANASACGRVLSKCSTSKPAASSPSRVCCGVARKLAALVAAHGVG
jgi:hypothetical protein